MLPNLTRLQTACLVAGSLAKSHRSPHHARAPSGWHFRGEFAAASLKRAVLPDAAQDLRRIFRGDIRRGLIEASPNSPCDAEHQRPISAAIFAAASLKPDALRARTEDSRLSFRGIFAAASLKRSALAEAPPCGSSLPRHIRRGLIEASSGRRSRLTVTVPFPRHIRRGLIEAVSMAGSRGST